MIHQICNLQSNRTCKNENQRG